MEDPGKDVQVRFGQLVLEEVSWSRREERGESQESRSQVEGGVTVMINTHTPATNDTLLSVCRGWKRSLSSTTAGKSNTVTENPGWALVNS